MIITLLILIINGGDALRVMLFHDPYTPLRHCQRQKATMFPLDSTHRVTMVDYASKSNGIWHSLESYDKHTIEEISAPLGEPLDDYVMRPHARHMTFLEDVARGVVEARGGILAYPDIICLATYHCFATGRPDSQLLALIAAVEHNASALDECASPLTAQNVAYALTQMVEVHWRHEYDAFLQRYRLACPAQHGLEGKVRDMYADTLTFWDHVMDVFGVH